MFPLHVKNGFYLGISCIGATVGLYLIGIEVMLLLKLYVMFGLYIFWMRRSVKERLDLGGDLTRNNLFESAWMTFILGITMSILFMHLFANFGDTNIIEVTKALNQKSHDVLAARFEISPERLEEMESDPTYRNPYGLRAFASLLPLYFILPGALIAFVIATVYKSKINTKPIEQA
jgi:hypothetical protein